MFAEDFMGAQAAHFLHLRIPGEVAQVAVHDNEAYLGALEDIVVELMGIHEGFGGGAGFGGYAHDGEQTGIRQRAGGDLGGKG